MTALCRSHHAGAKLPFQLKARNKAGVPARPVLDLMRVTHWRKSKMKRALRDSTGPHFKGGLDDLSIVDSVERLGHGVTSGVTVTQRFLCSLTRIFMPFQPVDSAGNDDMHDLTLVVRQRHPRHCRVNAAQCKSYCREPEAAASTGCKPAHNQMSHQRVTFRAPGLTCLTTSPVYVTRKLRLRYMFLE